VFTMRRYTNPRLPLPCKYMCFISPHKANCNCPGWSRV